MTQRDYGPVGPMPENFREMPEAARVGDKVAFAKEQARYNEQLIAAGLPPTYEVLDGFEDTQPTLDSWGQRADLT